jgi:hypothetical protein
MEIYVAEQLVPEPHTSEVETAIVTQALGETIYSEIQKNHSFYLEKRNKCLKCGTNLSLHQIK